MVHTDHQRIGIALELLSEGIFPYFEQQLREFYGDRWEEAARGHCRSQAYAADSFHWDAQAILTVMWDTWNNVFRKNLGVIERSIVSELREFRNRWAHQTDFSEDDVYRVLDNVQRLLRACGETTIAGQIEELKYDLLRAKLGRRVNEDLARSRFNRTRMIDTGLYGLCAFVIVSTMLLMWGSRHPVPTAFVISFTLFVFGYLIARRWNTSPPAYGVHECTKCGKVIYSEVCPYCEPVTRAAADRSLISNWSPDRN